MMDFLVELNMKVNMGVGYLVRLEPGVQTPEQTFQIGTGSCRDSAWLLVNAARALGLAARFVSGYLIQLTPDVKSVDGPSGTEVDFTDLHAWAEIYLPGAGWVGLDATSGLLTGEGHLPLAATPAPGTAAPISGALEQVETEFHFEMDVSRINEAPRITMPFNDESWARLDAVGDKIDQQLVADDVRLTTGGEPTFVSIDAKDDPQWNSGAVGEEKRALSMKLLRRLAGKFGEGGILHYGQGKWYPGESLPRWADTVYWRRDGVPIWNDPSLLADPDKDLGHTSEDAEKFIKHLATELGVSPEAPRATYEDVGYFLWKEHKLPPDVTPENNKLADPEERARLSATFHRGLNKPIGYIMPLQRKKAQQQAQQQQSISAGGWLTEVWEFRRENIYLVPGDSPAGLRLPLQELEWGDGPPTIPNVIPRDPSSVDLDDPIETQESIAGAEQEAVVDPDTAPQKQELGVRTALCVEAREGKLHVFFPPLEGIEDYIDLANAVERTASALGLPVVIEGERPPSDPRLERLSVTPDPGVLEVNVHPTSTWSELCNVTETLYEEARQIRLGTEKFMVDGRHTGTGGGNHVVMGGATTKDSPFLRRPDLLKSLLGYWLEHPSLSFLFSGLFIGPTSQAPRLDEARSDSIYELELAFRQVPDPNDMSKLAPSPWLTDRIFRNLLTDVTGNCHRTEFCIDKLYSPDSPTGRLGLLELRGFEMPPHPRMALAAHLLVRGLTAMFWRKPHMPTKLPRWGTALHDRFMLPHLVWADFREVLKDLNEAGGFAFEEEWFRAQFEFRFPFIGKVEAPGGTVNMEIRTALEPWHVLGEEGIAGGTVRYVDSSLERLEVRVSGDVGKRYIASCNGREIPLLSAGDGTVVGGVRFRAWAPSNSLHPLIGVDVPLIFDLYDTYSGRSVAGATYNVAHPGGLSHESFPVNGNEAESRRLSRFSEGGHTGGLTAPPAAFAAQPTGDFFPTTLDLRT